MAHPLQPYDTRMRRIATMLFIVALTACTADTPIGGSTVTGAYSLRTVNGAPLPYTTAGSGTNKTELVDDTFTLFQGGTYSRVMHTRATVNGTATTTTITDSGPYGLQGTSITFTSNANQTQTLANYTRDAFTVVKSGVTSEYSK